MKTFSPAQNLFLEFGQTTLQVLDEDRGIELRLDRLEHGRLSPESKERIVAGLQGFLKQGQSWRQRRALCALSARGVSWRRFTIPAVAAEERHKLLALQMEGEFPLPPDALAWGHCPAPQKNGMPRGPGQEYLVAALKRELFDEYAEVLRRAGLSSVFTLSAFARSALCPSTPGSCALLEPGRQHSELILLENGMPTAARVLAWGTENVTAATESILVDAEKLGAMLDPGQLGTKLYVLGELSNAGPFLQALGSILGLPCEPIDFQAAPGKSSATLGLQRLCQNNGAALPLILQSTPEKRADARPGPDHWRWAAVAGLLLLISLTLRYGEAFVRKPALARKLNELKSQRGGLPKIDREYAFFQFYQTNQPPLMEELLLVANAAPNGARVDSAAISRRGELSLRGAMADSPQMAEFRSKLIDSGFFSNVSLDELSPTPDRQKTTFRLSAQLKPEGERPKLSLETLAKPRPGDKPAGPAPAAATPPGTAAPAPAPGPIQMPDAPRARLPISPP